MAEGMAAKAERHARRMAAGAEEARSTAAAIRASSVGEARRLVGTCARVSSRGDGGWGDEARRNLEAALARAVRRPE
eukprot:502944-Prymnesium_polylepis.1